jgi:hypothetical protein
MPVFSASVIGEDIVSHGQNVNVDSAHVSIMFTLQYYIYPLYKEMKAATALFATPLQYLSDWVDRLYTAVTIMVKYLGSYLLLLTATLLGDGGGSFGVQSVSAQQYLLGLGIGDVTG